MAKVYAQSIPVINGSEVYAYVIPPFEDAEMFSLDTLQTLTLATKIETSAVYALGIAYPKGYTTGTRTVAGEMVFAWSDRQPLQPLSDILEGRGYYNEVTMSPFLQTLAHNKNMKYDYPPELLPPFTLMLIATPTFTRSGLPEQIVIGIFGTKITSSAVDTSGAHGIIRMTYAAGDMIITNSFSGGTAEDTITEVLSQYQTPVQSWGAVLSQKLQEA